MFLSAPRFPTLNNALPNKLLQIKLCTQFTEIYKSLVLKQKWLLLHVEQIKDQFFTDPYHKMNKKYSTEHQLVSNAGLRAGQQGDGPFSVRFLVQRGVLLVVVELEAALRGRFGRGRHLSEFLRFCDTNKQ